MAFVGVFFCCPRLPESEEGVEAGATWVKNLPAMQKMQETQVLSLSQEGPLEEEMAIHSSILAWRTPWTEGPGGLQSTGSQKVIHD